jgi:hypothetical protein
VRVKPVITLDVSLGPVEVTISPSVAAFTAIGAKLKECPMPNNANIMDNNNLLDLFFFFEKSISNFN